MFLPFRYRYVPNRYVDLYNFDAGLVLYPIQDGVSRGLGYFGYGFSVGYVQGQVY